jgi:hypothetical protein
VSIQAVSMQAMAGHPVAGHPVSGQPVAVQAVSVRPPIRVWLCGGPSVVAVLAWDASVLPPVLREADEDDESGRGLAIVAALSAGWGFTTRRNFAERSPGRSSAVHDRNETLNERR